MSLRAIVKLSWGRMPGTEFEGDRALRDIDECYDAEKLQRAGEHEFVPSPEIESAMTAISRAIWDEWDILTGCSHWPSVSIITFYLLSNDEAKCRVLVAGIIGRVAPDVEYEITTTAWPGVSLDDTCGVDPFHCPDCFAGIPGDAARCDACGWAARRLDV